MALEIYNFHFAQGDRIIWLCEELKTLVPGFTYTAHIHPRGDTTSAGKQKLLSLAPSGTAPTMVDGNVNPPIHMSESQAILTYIVTVYGQGHLQIPVPTGGPTDPNIQTYAQYLFWLSFANGSAQAFLSADIYAGSLMATPGFPADSLEGNLAHKSFAARTPNHLSQYNERLAKSTYLAGETFSAADIMNIYALTLLRVIYPIDLTPYPNIVRWLKVVTKRPAYRRAMEVTEDGLPALTAPVVPRIGWEILLSLKPWTEDEGLVKMKKEQDAEDAKEGKA